MKNVTHQSTSYVEKALLEFLKEKATQHFGKSTPIQVILYGSRARGDHQKRSDYDLAIRLDPALKTKWSGFAVDVREEAPTLKKIDLVNISDCPEELRDRILEEGKIVYERKTQVKIMTTNCEEAGVKRVNTHFNDRVGGTPWSRQVQTKGRML